MGRAKILLSMCSVEEAEELCLFQTGSGGRRKGSMERGMEGEEEQEEEQDAQ